MKTIDKHSNQGMKAAAAAGYAPEPRTTLIRLVVIKPWTRRAIGLWAPIGSHTRSSKIMNHRLGRKRAWTFAHTLTLIALAALMSSCTKQPVGYLAVPLYAEDVKEIQAK